MVGGRNPEVAEHGIGLPAPQELDMVWSTPAQSRAVAPPGQRLRAESRAGSMPVAGWRSRAVWQRALVMNLEAKGHKCPVESWLVGGDWHGRRDALGAEG